MLITLNCVLLGILIEQAIRAIFYHACKLSCFKSPVAQVYRLVKLIMFNTIYLLAISRPKRICIMPYMDAGGNN